MDAAALAALVYKAYNSLPKKGKPSPKSYDWTVLAAFLLEDATVVRASLLLPLRLMYSTRFRLWPWEQAPSVLDERRLM
jgi:hypothetical protein